MAPHGVEVAHSGLVLLLRNEGLCSGGFHVMDSSSTFPILVPPQPQDSSPSPDYQLLCRWALAWESQGVPLGCLDPDHYRAQRGEEDRVT